MAIAAEFKRASPSKGDIAVGLNAGEQGSLYASVGAAVLSVLTEPKWFKGSLEDMKEVRLATQGMKEGRAKLRWVWGWPGGEGFGGWSAGGVGSGRVGGG